VVAYALCLGLVVQPPRPLAHSSRRGPQMVLDSVMGGGVDGAALMAAMGSAVDSGLMMGLADASFTDAELLGTPAESVSPLANSLTLLLAIMCGFLLPLDFGGDADEGGDPDAPSKQIRRTSTTSEEERLSSFGWIHADHRTPLPSLEGLQDACHLVGVRDGKEMYLCAEPSKMPKAACAASRDFSEYYGVPVYICKGRAA